MSKRLIVEAMGEYGTGVYTEVKKNRSMELADA